MLLTSTIQKNEIDTGQIEQHLFVFFTYYIIVMVNILYSF